MFNTTAAEQRQVYYIILLYYVKSHLHIRFKRIQLLFGSKIYGLYCFAINLEIFFPNF